jgi:hypothetical protein
MDGLLFDERAGAEKLYIDVCRSMLDLIAQQLVPVS